MSLLKLTDIKTPTLSLELPDGTKKEFDLYELGERLDALARKEDEADGVSAADHYDGLRGVFDLPTKAKAEADGVFTLSRAQCETLQTKVVKDISEQPEKKSFFDLRRRLCGLESSPAR